MYLHQSFLSICGCRNVQLRLTKTRNNKIQPWPRRAGIAAINPQIAVGIQQNTKEKATHTLLINLYCAIINQILTKRSNCFKNNNG